MRYYSFLTLWLCLFKITGYSQIAIKIINEANQPIEWVTVAWNKKMGLVTDKTGFVEIPNFNSIEDSVVISCIGFKTAVIAKRDFYNITTKTITLEKNFIAFPSIIIGKKKTSVYGINNEKSDRSSVVNQGSSCLAGLIKIEGYNPESIVKNFSVFIDKKTSGVVPYRILLYTSINGFPGENIMPKNIIITSYKKNQWSTNNLEDLQIRVPNDEFFIGIEWLPQKGNSSVLYVGMAAQIKEVITYFKYGNGIFKKNLRWGLDKSKHASQNSEYCFNPMFFVELLN